MKLFSGLKKQATGFLDQYKTGNPATYAAAQQAVGVILITDGLIGIDNPLGGKKRPGIFGTLAGIAFGVVFMLIPTFVNNVSNINKMTATTSAEVVQVGTGDETCSLTVSYNVDGKDYQQQSSMNSSSYCSLSAGQKVDINYDPSKPGSWAYDTKTVGMFLGVFFIAGLLVVISSAFTFVIRLLSIIFGWKILKEGRKNAANLPQDANFNTIVEEIKQNFAKSVFNFGGGNILSTVQPQATTQDQNNNPPQTHN